MKSKFFSKEHWPSYSKKLQGGFNTLRKEVESHTQKIDFSLDFNSTALANILVLGLLALIMFGLPQTSSMISYGYDNVAIGLYWTTFCFVLFSLVLYFTSRVATLVRREVLFKPENGADQKYTYKDDDLYLIASYLLPMFPHIILMVRSEPQHPFMLATSGFACLLFWFILTDTDRNEVSFGRGKWFHKFIKNYESRVSWISFFLFLLTFFIVLGYFWSISRGVKFNGSYGVAILDVVLIFLILVRYLLLSTFIVYENLPGIRFLRSKATWKKRHTIACLALPAILYFAYANCYKPRSRYGEIATFVSAQEIDSANSAGTIDSSQFRKDLPNYASEWLHNPQANDTANIYLVAGQGGGSRAGYWMSSILAQLDSEYSDFYENLFAVSTVSGSSVGAAIYTQHRNRVGSQQLDTIRNKLKLFFNRDYVSASAIKLLFKDPIEKMVYTDMRNRNGQLIRDEAQSYDEIFAPEISDESAYNKAFPIVAHNDSIFRGPLLFLNTYNIDSSRKSVISSVRLPRYDHEDMLAGIEGKAHLSLGEAVNLSQMFPILSASAKVVNSDYYDGGAYDNSGLSTIRDIYGPLSYARDQFAPNRRIIVLYAENGAGRKDDDSAVNNGTAKPDYVTSEVKLGLGALIRAAMGSIFVANTRKHLNKLTKSLQMSDDTVLVKEFSYPQKVTLNRWLSKSDCDAMWDTIRFNISRDPVRSVFQSRSRDRRPILQKYSVYFSPGESQVSEYDKLLLRRLTSDITPEQVTLVVYTDSDTNPLNPDEELAEDRYNAVKSILKDQCSITDFSIDKAFIHEGPSDRMGKQAHRRVDITFTFYRTKKGYYPPPSG